MTDVAVEAIPKKPGKMGLVVLTAVVLLAGGGGFAARMAGGESTPTSARSARAAVSCSLFNVSRSVTKKEGSA